MLDWLKTILGNAYTEEIDKKVSAEIGKGFISRTDFNTLNETKKTLEGQLADRDKQLEELKKADPEKLQAEITRLQGENTATKEKLEADLKAVKLNFALESKLAKEGAVNTKAVRALLDSSKISLDGENLIGVDEQLKTLKETERWAFSTSETQRQPFVPPNPGETAPIGNANQEMNNLIRGKI